MKIRKATIKDLDAISKLFLEYDIYEKSLDKKRKVDSFNKIKKQTAKYLKNPDFVFLVIEENKEVLGVQSLDVRKRGKDNLGTLHTMIITKKVRGKGYGHKLFKAAIKYFKSKKCVSVSSLVEASNKPAQKYWKRQGFSLYGPVYRMNMRLK